MFVRNQGDEGYCSSQVWDLGLEDYTVRLPWRPGMRSVDVDWGKRNSSALMEPPGRPSQQYPRRRLPIRRKCRSLVTFHSVRLCPAPISSIGRLGSVHQWRASSDLDR